MKEIYIVEALRTPIGSFNGSLSTISASKLGEIVIRELLNKTNIPNDQISEIIMGQVLTAGKGQNPARQAAINAGISIATPAWNIGQVCGSGLKAIALGAQAIKCDDASIIIAGGQENMSQAMHVTHLRQGTKMGDSKLIDSMISDGLWDAFYNYHMGITAENIAKKYNISREQQDEFALQSQQKATIARDSGRFVDEIVPINISSKNKDELFSIDEFIRSNTLLESLAKLRPVFDKDGTVTAGNASGINDGAAAILMMNEESLIKFNLKPIAKIVSWANSGVDPQIMGTGPIPAVKKALCKANWKIDDLDLIESNEAFAAQAISVNKELGWDINKVNVNGGAIAIGHPIGASGARITTTLIHEIKKRKAKKAIATLCVGGGMGVAMCFEGIF